MSVDLTRELAQSFALGTRQKGAVYHSQGRVRLVRQEPTQVRAIVRGTRPYMVSLDRTERGAWQLSCDCPAFDDGPCKHLWATVLALREASAPAGAAAAETEPGDERATPAELRARFQRRVEHALGAAEQGAQGASASAAAAGTASAASAAASAARAAASPPLVPAWKRRIDALSADLGPAAAAEAGDARRRVIYALLPSSDPVDRGRPTLELFSQAHGKQGEWLAARPFHLYGEHSLRSLPPDDHRMLSAILGARPADGYGAWYGRGSRYELPDALARSLLPELARAGRLFLRRSSATSALEPVAHDAGGPWRFAFELTRDAGPSELVLAAVLQRGEQRTRLSPEDLWLRCGLCVLDQELREVEGNLCYELSEPLRSGGALRVPESQSDELFALLRRLPADVELAADEVARRVGGAPAPCLYLLAPEAGPSGEGERVPLRARVEFDYEGERVRSAAVRSLSIKSDRLLRIERDAAAERRALQHLWAAGVAPLVPAEADADATLPADQLVPIVEQLRAHGWSVEADGRPLRTDGELSFSVRSGIDWFDLGGQVAFGGLAIELPELLAAARERRRVVTLADGSAGLLPESWLAGWGLALAVADERKDGLRFKASQAWILDALLAERAAVASDAGFERARERLRRFERVEARREPKSFHGELRPYQREGLGWLLFLRELGLGGCLADDMGLGKTIQVLALLLARPAAERGPVLVVAPKSLVFNWKNEAARFAPKLRVLEHTGLGRSKDTAAIGAADLVLTTYGTLRRDAVLLSKLRFDCAILDEAQSIKNAESQSAKAARLLQADHRLALTGTPVENHLGDLASLFEFLNPGMLGRSRALDRVFRAAPEEPEALARLAKALRPFFLRRTKEQVLADLPAKTEQPIMCALEGEQKREYKRLADHYRQALLTRADAEGLGKIQMHVLEALLRLRQAACHLGLIDPARAASPSAKLEALRPLLDELREEGHKALVFSQFTSFLALLRSELDRDGVKYEYLDGKTTDREQRVARFQSDADCPLFLISLKAGGFGLNLTAADYVFLLDPWWNPAVERQAIDRTHRIGQTRSVTAYRLIAQGTIEEKVLELQNKKRALAEALFDSESTTLRDLSREDLEFLLS